MELLANKLKEIVSAWPNISIHRHQFGASEFRFDKAEVGHVHFWGDVDIPFTRKIRDVLLQEHRANVHRWVPESGWTTFHVSNEGDIQHALWLLRLSYLRFAVKQASNPRALMEDEAEKLRLSPALSSLLMQFVPQTAMREKLIAT